MGEYAHLEVKGGNAFLVRRGPKSPRKTKRP
jgi:hypothetical protein